MWHRDKLDGKEYCEQERWKCARPHIFNYSSRRHERHQSAITKDIRETEIQTRQQGSLGSSLATKYPSLT